jgi:Protein of unknown function (DUF3489)
MTKLTDAQLAVLSKAAKQDDGAAAASETMSRAAAAKVGASLIARKLMREAKAKPGMPVWREVDGKRISLVITRAGRTAVERGDDEKGRAPVASGHGGATVPQSSEHAAPRIGSKQSLLVDMLSMSDGATLGALVGATGWLPHTARAALTGLRKRGYGVHRSKLDGVGSVYRIAPGASLDLK